MKIGIPKAMYYYYFNNKWQYFFKELNIEVVESGETTKAIVELGNSIANDEMCLSLKIFLGHVASLEGKCDYVLIPRIENFGIKDQMCANYLSLYDLVNNLFNLKILNYNIDYVNKESELNGLIAIGKTLKISAAKIKKAYAFACNKEKQTKQLTNILNYNKLKNLKKKILLIAHSYNLYDSYIGKPIINILKKMGCEVIMCDKFDEKITNELADKFSQDLYWKHAREAIGSIILCGSKIDGVIFLTTFPCGLDSLVNELVMRKIKLPYLNLILDDLDSLAGVETRIESFVDILEQV